MLGCDRGGQDTQLAPRPSPGKAAGSVGTTWAARGRGMRQPHAPHNDTGGCQAREGPVPPAQPGDVPHAQAHHPLTVSPPGKLLAYDMGSAVQGAPCVGAHHPPPLPYPRHRLLVFLLVFGPTCGSPASPAPSHFHSGSDILSQRIPGPQQLGTHLPTATPGAPPGQKHGKSTPGEPSQPGSGPKTQLSFI